MTKKNRKALLRKQKDKARGKQVHDVDVPKHVRRARRESYRETPQKRLRRLSKETAHIFKRLRPGHDYDTIDGITVHRDDDVMKRCCMDTPREQWGKAMQIWHSRYGDAA